MRYMVSLPPDSEAAGKRTFPVLYLLHGKTGSSEDWGTKSRLNDYLGDSPIIAVMPDGNDSYYANAVHKSRDRYEDYITIDLPQDVTEHYPATSSRVETGIAGVSMGGHGAIRLALRHPDKYAFAAGISSPVDITSRKLTFRRFFEYFRIWRIFGAMHGANREANEVFALVRRPEQTNRVFFYVSCGDKEPLLGPNRSFAVALNRSGQVFAFHQGHGYHDWSNWDAEIRNVVAVFQNTIGRPVPIPIAD